MAVYEEKDPVQQSSESTQTDNCKSLIAKCLEYGDFLSEAPFFLACGECIPEREEEEERLRADIIKLKGVLSEKEYLRVVGSPM